MAPSRHWEGRSGKGDKSAVIPEAAQPLSGTSQRLLPPRPRLSPCSPHLELCAACPLRQAPPDTSPARGGRHQRRPVIPEAAQPLSGTSQRLLPPTPRLSPCSPHLGDRELRSPLRQAPPDTSPARGGRHQQRPVIPEAAQPLSGTSQRFIPPKARLSPCSPHLGDRELRSPLRQAPPDTSPARRGRHRQRPVTSWSGSRIPPRPRLPASAR